MGGGGVGFQLSVSVWVDSVVGGDGVGFSAVRVSALVDSAEPVGWGGLGFQLLESQHGWARVGWGFQLS